MCEGTFVCAAEAFHQLLLGASLPRREGLYPERISWLFPLQVQEAGAQLRNGGLAHPEQQGREFTGGDRSRQAEKK